MPTDQERLGDEKYVQLTTYRRSGRAVPTPVWVARHGTELAVWAERTSGKVKRIRAGSRVEVTACDATGRKVHGRTVSGRARLLDQDETDTVRGLIRAKYGILGALGIYGSMLRGGKQRTIGIAITLDGAEPGGDEPGHPAGSREAEDT
ncbi:PPOX class F420-dependent oxidoreductase [Haloechinothrix sp. YIM 98757]|uniref:PPOX class F420-dependent oxidoreductase n=1 Tax=Haloechinothrix aidingensis TaxID=2752311 RepID=A0A837ZYB1_9PSEU|nr:PPOX class F420-dependent oxidoreductase [Haloechinothrix aidingensis]MBA0125626.1 PPOX class F420-dependent oxidoreductase [Haloechinothrix aidingensis]